MYSWLLLNVRTTLDSSWLLYMLFNKLGFLVLERSLPVSWVRGRTSPGITEKHWVIGGIWILLYTARQVIKGMFHRAQGYLDNNHKIGIYTSRGLNKWGWEEALKILERGRLPLLSALDGFHSRFGITLLLSTVGPRSWPVRSTFNICPTHLEAGRCTLTPASG